MSATARLIREGNVGLIELDNPPVNALAHGLRAGLHASLAGCGPVHVTARNLQALHLSRIERPQQARARRGDYRLLRPVGKSALVDFDIARELRSQIGLAINA